LIRHPAGRRFIPAQAGIQDFPRDSRAAQVWTPAARLVIPAQAGIQDFPRDARPTQVWAPASAGVTKKCEVTKRVIKKRLVHGGFPLVTLAVRTD
jgi:hypothetical protein